MILSFWKLIIGNGINHPIKNKLKNQKVMQNLKLELQNPEEIILQFLLREKYMFLEDMEEPITKEYRLMICTL